MSSPGMLRTKEMAVLILQTPIPLQREVLPVTHLTPTSGFTWKIMSSSRYISDWETINDNITLHTCYHKVIGEIVDAGISVNIENLVKDKCEAELSRVDINLLRSHILKSTKNSAVPVGL